MSPGASGRTPGTVESKMPGWNLAELVERTRLSLLVPALGGPPVKRGRCRAWFRGGRNDSSLSIDDARGGWYDFGTGLHGGVLDLIQTALSCSRRDAAVWLANFNGANLSFGRLHNSGQWRQRRQTAETKADDLSQWREGVRRELIRRRNYLWDSEACVSAIARILLTHPVADDRWAWDYIWEHALDDQQGDELQHQLEVFESWSPRQLMTIRSAAARRACP